MTLGARTEWNGRGRRKKVRKAQAGARRGYCRIEGRRGQLLLPQGQSRRQDGIQTPSVKLVSTHLPGDGSSAAVKGGGGATLRREGPEEGRKRETRNKHKQRETTNFFFSVLRTWRILKSSEKPLWPRPSPLGVNAREKQVAPPFNTPRYLRVCIGASVSRA